jgi:hypothetical protein
LPGLTGHVVSRGDQPRVTCDRGAPGPRRACPKNDVAKMVVLSVMR